MEGRKEGRKEGKGRKKETRVLSFSFHFLTFHLSPLSCFLVPPSPSPARLRVRSIRDIADGAMFYGRTWNMNTPAAPLVDIPKLSNIEFDAQNRAIISGRAIVRASPDAPQIENAFKIRTKLGTNGDGRYIKLKQPELAIVLECPEKIGSAINNAAAFFNAPAPKTPPPVVVFIPLPEARKLTQADRDKDGFDLGEDNKISEIWIEDGALRFKIQAMLRPGKFLGSNYLAFSVPIRTFILTTERVRNGIRIARINKKKQKKEEEKARAAVADAERVSGAKTGKEERRRRRGRRGRREAKIEERKAGCLSLPLVSSHAHFPCLPVCVPKNLPRSACNTTLVFSFLGDVSPTPAPEQIHFMELPRFLCL